MKAFVVILIAVFFFYIHSPIPKDCPDFYPLQFTADIFSLCETTATVLSKIGINRWLPYYGITKLLTLFTSYRDVNIEFTTFANVDSLVIRPKDETNNQLRPAVIFYHGGGFTLFNTDSHLDFMKALSKQTGYVVMSPNYHLSPEYPYPKPYQDCLQSTLEFLARASEFNVDPKRIILSGDSAGGNLAFSVLSTMIRMKEKDDSINIPVMQALAYPVLQLVNFKLDSYLHKFNGNPILPDDLLLNFWLSYLGIKDGNIDQLKNRRLFESLSYPQSQKINNKIINKKFDLSGEINYQKPLGNLLENEKMKQVLDWKMSPLLQEDQLLSKLPKTLLMVCGYDQLRDEGLILADLLEVYGVNLTLQYLPHSLHAVLNFGSLPSIFPYHGKETNKFIESIKDFVDGQNQN